MSICTKGEIPMNKKLEALRGCEVRVISNTGDVQVGITGTLARYGEQNVYTLWVDSDNYIAFKEGQVSHIGLSADGVSQLIFLHLQ